MLIDPVHLWPPSRARRCSLLITLKIRVNSRRPRPTRHTSRQITAQSSSLCYLCRPVDEAKTGLPPLNDHLRFRRCRRRHNSAIAIRRVGRNNADPDFLFRRIPFACRATNVLLSRLWRLRFLSCISATSRRGYDAGRGGEREAVSVLVLKTADEPGTPPVVPVNPNSRSVRTVRPHSQGRVMEQSSLVSMSQKIAWMSMYAPRATLSR